MKPTFLIIILFCSLGVVQAQKGLKFEPVINSSVSTFEDEGEEFLMSEGEKSGVILQLRPHPRNANFLSVVMMIGKMKGVEKLKFEVEDLESITVRRKKEKSYECEHPMEQAISLVYDRLFIENSAYLASVQEQFGLIGISNAKKKLKKQAAEEAEPSDFGLLSDVVLTDEKSTAVGVVNFPMISRRCDSVKICVNLIGEKHIFRFGVEEDKVYKTPTYGDLVDLGSRASEADKGAVQHMINQRAAAAFQKGYQQGTQQYQNNNYGY